MKRLNLPETSSKQVYTKVSFYHNHYQSHKINAQALFIVLNEKEGFRLVKTLIN